MIDWRIAAQVAETVASAQSTPDPAPFEAVAGPAEESERLVGAYTGLAVSAGGAGLPAAEPIARRQWIDANLGSMRIGARPGRRIASARGSVPCAAR